MTTTVDEVRTLPVKLLMRLPDDSVWEIGTVSVNIDATSEQGASIDGEFFAQLAAGMRGIADTLEAGSYKTGESEPGAS